MQPARPARGLGAAWLTVAACPAATEVAHGAAVSFRAAANGPARAVHTERGGAKVTAGSAGPTRVAARSGGPPRDVFCRLDRLPPLAWQAIRTAAGQGRSLPVHLRAGGREVRLTNLSGQPLNPGFSRLTPVP